ncbi:DUF6090 family protein [Psychroserpens ponticola]|uniref:DUF6090 family protein n=1 Tax=Psychroserpens ponticola TaxID=2932268 RepID=A0ABY7RTL0_9FLAO|nr:DUF6090 family protein [Psychroserpens ponticola]WCO00449.1 DUF6090 family protein [Psychroserpens ponticola]
MIKFFRHIRKNLLIENKTSKYFKYAIGEIILVVIGILIALQINNWNESRKHAIAEQEFFKSVKDDLTQDLEFINYVQSYSKPKVDAYNLLSSRCSEDYDSDKSQIDSLMSVYLFSGQRTFYPVSGAFKSSIAGNEINTYKQKKIIQNIIKLYGSNYDRLIDNGKIVDDRWSKLSETYIYSRRTSSFDKVTNEVYSKMLDDFHFHFIQLNWYNQILDDTEKEVNQLLKQL